MKQQQTFFDTLLSSLRLILGPPNVCIYPVSCSTYARFMLANKPFYISIPLITLRLISCNPITGIAQALYYNAKQKNSLNQRIILKKG
jgi:putative component of membrane protein insertase Oxa1/YidC/SpoIIIJ protein YidD